MHPRSNWNNPEPEVVLLISWQAAPWASPWQHVNLRDFDGRSALLLTKAKDNNASPAPSGRSSDRSMQASIFDGVRHSDVDMRVDGAHGYRRDGQSSMTQISRDQPIRRHN